jgi:hypothetical protein
MAEQITPQAEPLDSDEARLPAISSLMLLTP